MAWNIFEEKSSTLWHPWLDVKRGCRKLIILCSVCYLLGRYAASLIHTSYLQSVHVAPIGICISVPTHICSCSTCYPQSTINHYRACILPCNIETGKDCARVRAQDHVPALGHRGAAPHSASACQYSVLPLGASKVPDVILLPSLKLVVGTRDWICTKVHNFITALQ